MLRDRVSSALAAASVRLFFRRTEVIGAHAVPREGPLIVVANHPNSLIDPVVLLAMLPRRLRFLGKSTLWDNPGLRPFLALGGVLPVYRRQDEGVDPSHNVGTFEACYDALGRGDAIALFPEGMSHTEPEMQPLKTGAARIALGGALRRRELGEEARVTVLPVGLTFDARQRFRSRALVWIGEAISITDPPNDEAGFRDAARAWTERIALGLRDVTINFRSWEDARLAARGLEIYRTGLAGPTEDPRLSSMAEALRLQRDVAEALPALRHAHPAEAQAALEAIRRYDRILASLALTDDQVTRRTPARVAIGFALRTTAFLLLTLPLAILGVAINGIPYALVKSFAARQAEEPDQEATWKLFAALFLYPLLWLLEAVLLSVLLFPSAALGLWILAVPTGLAALSFDLRRRRLRREARAWWLLGRRPALAERLRRRRQRVADRISTLLELWQHT